MNFLRMKPKKRCVICDVKVGNSPAYVRYKYIENDEPKVGTAYLCKKCSDQMNQTETDDDDTV